MTKLDFPLCYKSSKSLVAGDLFFWYNNVSPSRLGVIVPKTYGKAHERNLFKRRCRNIFTNIFTPDQLFCIIVRPKKKSLSYLEIFNSFNLFKNTLHA
ncbi:MAG: ribonuclease P protein component [Candidatus Marinimicrobia bacterium]|nr:ribonuclease P protein component [Candidatus Neomarinimicrobiota bacterium]